MPTNVKPLKAKLTGAGNLESLAEFESGDVVDIVDGGTGAASFTSNQVLVGQGTAAISSISRGNLVAGSNKVLINSSSSASGVVLGGNLTIDVVESSIDLSKTTGRVALSKVLQQEPGTVDAQYSFANLATTDVPDENGNITYDGEEF